MEELPRPFPQGRLLGDERLARLASSGSTRAFATLYERYHQALYRYCRSILRDEVDSQDAVQSTFARALDALRRGQRDAPLSPWLFRIAHNEAISMIRRRESGTQLSARLERSLVVVEDRTEERERLGSLLADLQELPERQRGALLMRELSGLSHVEIAIALGTTTGGAKQAIFEARTALADFEEGRAMACAEIRRLISAQDRRALRGRRVAAHLRDCAACAAFEAATSSRRQGAFALIPASAGGAVARLMRSAGSSAPVETAATTGFGSLLAGKLAGTAVLSKVMIGAALLAGVAAETGDVLDGGAHPPSAIAAGPLRPLASVLTREPARTGQAQARRRPARHRPQSPHRSSAGGKAHATRSTGAGASRVGANVAGAPRGSRAHWRGAHTPSTGKADSNRGRAVGSSPPGRSKGAGEASPPGQAKAQGDPSPPGRAKGPGVPAAPSVPPGHVKLKLHAPRGLSTTAPGQLKTHR
jgi:RNA polymerase sigma factor (sigma-70 family)